MTYEQTIAYLYEKLPVFHRVGGEALKPGLQNITALCEALGNPQNEFKSIHVAGTNGKGSTSHTLSAILQTAGYKVGLHTSPHLKDFTERFKINGQPADNKLIVDFVEQHQSLIETIQPSFFEISVAIAFYYFAKQKVDIAIIEVGLGGRLDSTNIITPILSVITNISFDHTQFLGDTLAAIASEKAGIIKSNVPVVISEYHADTEPVFIQKAQDENSKIYLSYNKYSIKSKNITDGKRTIDVFSESNLPITLTTDLIGEYQLKNFSGIFQTVEVLNTIGYNIDNQHIIKSFGSICSLTNFKGRWQMLRQSPIVVADVAHNKAGLAETLSQIKTYAFDNLHIVLGFVKDKDIESILPMFPSDAKYYFCQPDIFRALPAESLAEIARKYKLFGNSYINVNEALTDALSIASQNDFVYVGGSTFVVSELADI